ncbi:hypothetical protein FACS189426_11120 [Bacteroidia bacterium]|nr:hypothetical protein FACS189426_11120 [Bacteroidia bacterium]
MKKNLQYCSIFISALIVFFSMTGNQSFAQQKRVNWGIRVGLNALSTTRYETFYNDEAIPNDSYTNKNGYLINGFARFNIKRIFLQPEIAWNYYRMGISFSLPLENVPDTYAPPTYMDINSKSVRGNFLTGYNIVSNKPFIFSAFVGTGFAGIYDTQYTTSLDEDYSNKDIHIKYVGVGGFSIIISNIHFDVRYEINQPNSNLNFDEIPGFPERYRGIDLKKNENSLSFSCGLIF